MASGLVATQRVMASNMSILCIAYISMPTHEIRKKQQLIVVVAYRYSFGS
jgi:hypothetical protein